MIGKSNLRDLKPSNDLGPGYYTNDKNFSKTIGNYSFGKQIRDKDNDQRRHVPGPGQYQNPGKFYDNRGGYIGKGNPKDRDSNVPGPGVYYDE